MMQRRDAPAVTLGDQNGPGRRDARAWASARQRELEKIRISSPRSARDSRASLFEFKVNSTRVATAPSVGCAPLRRRWPGPVLRAQLPGRFQREVLGFSKRCDARSWAVRLLVYRRSQQDARVQNEAANPLQSGLSARSLLKSVTHP
jgi:hypothetical protein